MLKGGCHCGHIRYTLSQKPFASEYCHCQDCQRITGAPVSAWMDFKIEQVHWEKAKPTEYASSESIRRGFCEICGSTLSYRSTKHPNYITLSVTSLDDPTQVNPNYHIYYASKVPWMRIDDNHTRYQKEKA